MCCKRILLGKYELLITVNMYLESECCIANKLDVNIRFLSRFDEVGVGIGYDRLPVDLFLFPMQYTYLPAEDCVLA